MTYRLLSQIVLIVLSVVAVVSYVSPKFSELQQVQLEIKKYREAVARADQYNSTLSEKLNKITSLSQSDLQMLERYLPSEVDPIMVARDIETIALRNDLEPTAIEVAEAEAGSNDAPVEYVPAADEYYGEDGTGMGGGEEYYSAPQQPLTSKLDAQPLSVTVTGSYEDFLVFLADLERNNYPLRIRQLTVGAEGEGEETVSSDVYTFDLEVATFAFSSIPTPAVTY